MLGSLGKKLHQPKSSANRVVAQEFSIQKEYNPVEVELKDDVVEKTEEDLEHEAKVILLKDEIRKRTIQNEIFARKETETTRKQSLARMMTAAGKTESVMPGVTSDFKGAPIEIKQVKNFKKKLLTEANAQMRETALVVKNPEKIKNIMG